MSQKITIAANQLTGFNGAAVSLGNGLGTVKSAAIANPGSGYKTGDILTVSGGTVPAGGVVGAAKLRVEEVDSLNSGVIRVVTVILHGVYTALPTNPVSVAGGNGSGATFTLTNLNNAPPLDANVAELINEGGDVRWRDDGIAPTSTVGMLLKQVSGTGNNSVTQPFVYQGPLQAMQVIGLTAGSILNVEFYGPRSKQ